MTSVIPVPHCLGLQTDDRVDRVLDVLGFEVGELALLPGHIDVEQREVGLAGDRLDERRILDAGWTCSGWGDVARIGERSRADRGLLEVTVRMAGCRDTIGAI